MARLARLGPVALLAASLALGPVAAAGADRTDWPMPPCAGSPAPPYPEIDGTPTVSVRFAEDGAETWAPPACTGWQPGQFTVLVATAGRFRHDGDADGLLRRLGAISRYTMIRYWSVTRGRWNDLITSASALAGPDGEARRGDFTLPELRVGRSLHFRQDENSPAGDLVYRLQILERRQERLVVAIENATAVDRLLIPLFDAGGYQFRYVIERAAGDRWRYFSLARALVKSPLSFRGPEESYVNRAVAVYRYIAGIPTDREPPAAP